MNEQIAKELTGMTIGRKAVYAYMSLPYHKRRGIWDAFGFRAKGDESDFDYSKAALDWLRTDGREHIADFMVRVGIELTPSPTPGAVDTDRDRIASLEAQLREEVSHAEARDVLVLNLRQELREAREAALLFENAFGEAMLLGRSPVSKAIAEARKFQRNRALTAPKEQPQARVEESYLCDTTMTARAASHWCACLKRTDQMGPCFEANNYLVGCNGRCVFCDHEEYCHRMLANANGYSFKPKPQADAEKDGGR